MSVDEGINFIDKRVKDLKKSIKDDYNSVRNEYSQIIIDEIEFLKALKKVSKLKKAFNDFGFRILIDKNQCQVES